MQIIVRTRITIREHHPDPEWITPATCTNLMNPRTNPSWRNRWTTRRRWGSNWRRSPSTCATSPRKSTKTSSATSPCCSSAWSSSRSSSTKTHRPTTSTSACTATCRSSSGWCSRSTQPRTRNPGWTSTTSWASWSRPNSCRWRTCSTSARSSSATTSRRSSNCPSTWVAFPQACRSGLQTTSKSTPWRILRIRRTNFAPNSTPKN